MNGQWSMPWMAELEENKRAVALAAGEDPKTPSTGTPADTQPNTPVPGTHTQSDHSHFWGHFIDLRSSHFLETYPNHNHYLPNPNRNLTLPIDPKIRFFPIGGSIFVPS